MKKLVLGAMFGLLAACGGGDESPDARIIRDGGGGGGIDAGNPGACNILTQTGCDAGQKCAWVRVQVSAATQLGQLACVPDGTVAVDGQCQYGAQGATTGFDNCQAGLVCLASSATDMAQGTCRTICDLAEATASAACPTNFACGAYSSFFENEGDPMPAAGVCDPTCDPLTQVRLSDSAPACGSMDPMMPTRGCYGAASQDNTATNFTCTGAGDPMLRHRSPVTAPIFLNSCAPGYVPLLREMTGSMTTVCIAYCDPVNTLMGATVATSQGMSPHSCPDKGATAQSEQCRYLWWFEGNQTPISAASDAYGFCVDYTRYQYDSNNDMTPDTAWPSCRTLVANAADPMNPVDAAWAWGCTDSSTIPAALTGGRRPSARDYGLNLILPQGEMDELIKSWRKDGI